MKKILKDLFVILFFFGAVFGLYAGGLKSITIKHIGEQDYILDVLVINTHKNGFILDIVWPYYYIAVQESLFDEIMGLINENKELFDEDRRGYEYGSFQLYIEDEDEGEKYYLYLNERNSSIIFFKKLYELIKPLNNYNEFKSRLLELIINIDWKT